MRPVSDSYSERKIDVLDERLTNIESALVNIASKLENNSSSAAPRERTNQASLPLIEQPDEAFVPEVEVKTPAPFEGETGMNTQSKYVRDLLVQVVGDTPSVGQNAEVRAALTALGELTTRQNHDNVSTTSTDQSLSDRSLSNIDSSTIPRPPWDVVKVAIDMAMSC